MESMRLEEKKQLLAWHTAKQEKILGLPKELSYSGQQDVSLWREACRSDRNEMVVMTGCTFYEKKRALKR